MIACTYHTSTTATGWGITNKTIHLNYTSHHRKPHVLQWSKIPVTSCRWNMLETWGLNQCYLHVVLRHWLKWLLHQISQRTKIRFRPAWTFWPNMIYHSSSQNLIFFPHSPQLDNQQLLYSPYFSDVSALVTVCCAQRHSWWLRCPQKRANRRAITQISLHFLRCHNHLPAVTLLIEMLKLQNNQHFPYIQSLSLLPSSQTIPFKPSCRETLQNYPLTHHNYSLPVIQQCQTQHQDPINKTNSINKKTLLCSSLDHYILRGKVGLVVCL